MTKPKDALQPGDALLLVDVQIDFCPGGNLPVAEGDKVVPVLNRWLAAARKKGIPVYASRDWHPSGHMSFAARGGQWPEHCLQDSPGAAFHPDLALPDETVVISKGVRFDKDQYSAFDETGLAERLHQDGVTRVWVGGLALDVCVEATALGGREAGFDVRLIPEASKAITADGAARAIAAMCEAGVTIQDALE